MGLGNLPEGEGGDGVRGAVPRALTRSIFLENLKQFWDLKALGQCAGCFWSLHPVWDTLGSAETWHGGHREGVASTLEQKETNQGCEVLGGILQVQRLCGEGQEQLCDLVTSSCLGCPYQRITLHVLGHPPAGPHLQLCWERSSCDCSSSRCANLWSWTCWPAWWWPPGSAGYNHSVLSPTPIHCW